jgi:hypothetical protein
LEAVTELAVVAKNFSQAAYLGLQKSLQQEWHFVQRVKEDVGDEFANIEEAISLSFLPALFCNDYNEDDPCHNLACFPVKHDGLAIPDPTVFCRVKLGCQHIDMLSSFGCPWGH